MPRKPRELKRPKILLTQDQLEIHCHGYVLFANHDVPFKDDDERRKSWFEHKDYIMSLRGKVAPEDAGFSLRDRVYFDEYPASYYRYEKEELCHENQGS